MRASRRSGFTLIEVVVAAFVFAVGVLALEATAVTVLRQMRRSGDLAFAASVARSRLERLSATSCDALASGADTIRSVVSTWTVGTTPSPSIRFVSQTISYKIDGTDREDIYHAMVHCSP